VPIGDVPASSGVQRVVLVLATGADEQQAFGGRPLDQAILEYLQQSEWDERLDEMRTSEDDVLAGIAKLLDDIVSPNDASELRGAADRMLASYPDVPGILLARAAAEAFCRDSVLEVVERNVKAGWRFAEREYGIEFGILSNAVLWLTKVLYEKGRTDAAEAVVRASTDATKNPRALARLCVSGLPDRLAAGPPDRSPRSDAGQRIRCGKCGTADRSPRRVPPVRR